MIVHKLVHWSKGPKGKRVEMVQASFTDETGHHTNHMTKVAWEDKLAAVLDEPEDSGADVEGVNSTPCEAQPQLT